MNEPKESNLRKTIKVAFPTPKIGGNENICRARICQIKTIKNYLSHLNPELDWLFQRPRKPRSFKPGEDKVWYCKSPLGVNILDSMLKLMSSQAGIQPHLTNHCLRSTSVTVFSYNICETRHIQSVTGHKCDNSSESYNDRPSLDRQKKMSEALSSFLHGHEATSR